MKKLLIGLVALSATMAASVLVANVDQMPPHGWMDYSYTDDEKLYKPAVEDYILEFMNAERKKAGAQPLAMAKGLRIPARAHSLDMVRNNFMSHTGTGGIQFGDRLKVLGRDIITIGAAAENVAAIPAAYGNLSERETAKEYVEMWMNSEGHRKNMLNPEYTHVGIGVAFNEEGSKACQLFTSIVGTLKEPIPKKIKKGEKLNLAFDPVSDKYGAAVYLVIYDPSNSKFVSNMIPTDNPVINVPPGIYEPVLMINVQGEKDMKFFWGARFIVTE